MLKSISLWLLTYANQALTVDLLIHPRDNKYDPYVKRMHQATFISLCS